MSKDLKLTGGCVLNRVLKNGWRFEVPVYDVAVESFFACGSSLRERAWIFPFSFLLFATRFFFSRSRMKKHA